MTTLAQRIKELRKEKDLTQEEFGKIFGIVKSTVSLYESDKSTPDDEIKKQIAKFFNVSLDYLMGTSNIRNPYKDQEETPEANKAIEYAIKVARDNGYDISNLSKEELAEIIVRSLKIDEITKGN